MPNMEITFTPEQFDTVVNSLHEASTRKRIKALDATDAYEQAACVRVSQERMTEFHRLMKFAPIGPKLVDGRLVHVSGLYRVPAENTHANWAEYRFARDKAALAPGLCTPSIARAQAGTQREAERNALSFPPQMKGGMIV